MKKILTFLAFTLIWYTANAQNVGKSTISISLGPSFPIGKFALKDMSDEESGLAKIGGFLDLSYGYQLSKYLGITAALKGSVHGIDFSSYAVPSGVGASSQTTTTTWKTGAILVGLSQVFPLSEDGKFKFELRELAGIQSTKSPEVNVSINVPGIGNMNSKQESAKATSFAYALGAGFSYSVDRAIGLKLFADYGASNPKFDVSASSGTNTTQQESAQRINMVNLGVGLTIGF
jgi:hypothetical protein